MEKKFALLALRAGNSPVTADFPTQRPVTRSFDVFFDLRWINGWVNRCEAGDLKRHRSHYDVAVINVLLIWCVPHNPSIICFLSAPFPTLHQI